MQDINEYINLSREERRSHLSLEENCIERGGYSKEFRGLLADFLDTTIPRGSKIYLCHACNNEKCSNPNHLYWGTPTDNHLDQKEAGTYLSFNDRMKMKYGEEKAKEMIASRRKGKPSAGRQYSKEKLNSYKDAVRRHSATGWGWVTRCSKELGISHTQVKRFISRHMTDEILNMPS